MRLEATTGGGTEAAFAADTAPAAQADTDVDTDADAALRRFHALMLATGLPAPPLADWLPWARDNAELWPIHKHGEMVGGVFFKGHTVHLVVHPDWQGRWATRAMLRAFPTWTPAARIEAPIRPGNTRSIALARRLGFRCVADQGLYHLYVKEPAHAPHPPSPPVA